MKRLSALVLVSMVVVGLAVVGCTQAAPASAPTPPPTVKPAEPTKAPAASTKAPAAPTKVAAASPPTAAPAKKMDFPAKDKILSIIVPYPAGGGLDIAARLLSPLLEAELRTTAQVVNKGGAGGQIGWTESVLAAPDGYTLGFANLPATITTYLDPRRKAVYTRQSFQPLALHNVEPLVVAVKADSPFKTMKDMIDAAKANPGKVKVGLTGVGSTSHIALLQVRNEMRIDVSPVQFDGGAPELTALLGGHTDVGFDTPGIYLPHFKSGEARLLGVMDTEESTFFPGVKTMTAQGYNLIWGSSRGLFLPAGTPKEIEGILGEALRKSIQNPDHKKKMDDAGLPVRYLEAAKFGAYWDEIEAKVKPLMPDLLQ